MRAVVDVGLDFCEQLLRLTLRGARWLLVVFSVKGLRYPPLARRIFALINTHEIDLSVTDSYPSAVVVGAQYFRGFITGSLNAWRYFYPAMLQVPV